MLRLEPPPSPAPLAPIDAHGHLADREELARSLVALVRRVVSAGRLAGDSDSTTRSILRFALARAIEPGSPSRLRSGRLGNAPVSSRWPRSAGS